MISIQGHILMGLTNLHSIQKLVFRGSFVSCTLRARCVRAIPGPYVSTKQDKLENFG